MTGESVTIDIPQRAPGGVFGFRSVLAFVLVLVTITIVGAFLAASHYTRRAVQVAQFESRFVTTEWELLAQLKLETDQLLLEKDAEIIAMRERLLRLASGGDAAEGEVLVDESDPEVQLLMGALERAYAERQAIVARRLTVETTAENTAAVPEPSDVGADPPAAVTGDERTLETESAFALSPADIRFRQAHRMTINRLYRGELDGAAETLTELNRAIEDMHGVEARTVPVSVLRQMALLDYLYNTMRTEEALNAELEALRIDSIALGGALTDARRERNEAIEEIARLEGTIAELRRETPVWPVAPSVRPDRAEQYALPSTSTESGSMDSALILELEQAISLARDEAYAEARADFESETERRISDERASVLGDVEALVSILLGSSAGDTARLQDRALQDPTFEAILYRMQELALRTVPPEELPFPVPALIAIVVRPGATIVRAELTETDPPRLGDRVLIVPNGRDWDDAVGGGVITEVRGNRILIQPEEDVPVQIRDLIYRLPIQEADR